MSAKNCLLCGKTLVFIRVGAGGDFCSREHRNQYQLRRGMDCLAEANKVATLARRRETPKALFGEASAGSLTSPRRAFLEAAPLGILAGLNPSLRGPRPHGRIALLPRAAAIAKPAPGVAPRGVRREFGVRLAASTPAAVPHGPSACWKPARLGNAQARGLRDIAVSAAAGNALRVSSSAGFRLKAPGPTRLAYAVRTGGGRMVGMRASATSRPFALLQEGAGAAADARLAFVDMGFSSSPEAPARLDWLAAGRVAVIGRERREL